MKNIDNSWDYNVNESKIRLLKRFKLFVIKPTLIGLFIFSIFFSIILVTKVATYFVIQSSFFSLSIYDVLFAFIGFGVGFLVEFLLQIRRILRK